MKVLLAEDHPIVRVGIREILTRSFKDVFVAEASNARQFWGQLAKHRWDLILLDITLPGRSGLDVLRQLKDERPKLPVLVLSIHSENEYGVRALRAGASGYLNKEALPEQLLQAINKVLKGGVYVSDSLAERLAMDLTRKSTLLPHETLTDREYEVMRLIAAGMTSGEIASKLCLSVKTISTFRAHLLQKTGMRNNAAIMHYAIKHKLVD